MGGFKCAFIEKRPRVNTMDQDEQLIDAVREYPCLYNSKSPDFKIALKKENAWTVIAASLERDGKSSEKQCECDLFSVLYFLKSVDEVQKRWKTLRERFVREVKGTKKKSGQDAKSPVSWELFHHMELLRDFIKHRK